MLVSWIDFNDPFTHAFSSFLFTSDRSSCWNPFVLFILLLHFDPVPIFCKSNDSCTWTGRLTDLVNSGFLSLPSGWKSVNLIWFTFLLSHPMNLLNPEPPLSCTISSWKPSVGRFRSSFLFCEGCESPVKILRLHDFIKQPIGRTGWGHRSDRDMTQPRISAGSTSVASDAGNPASLDHARR